MPQIESLPAAADHWPAGEQRRVTVTCSLPAGRTLGDWAAFTLTIREDPDFPRTIATRTADLDPAGDGWALTAQATGAADVDARAVTFDVTAPAGPGEKRYSLDVWGTGGTAGAVQLYRASWLTVRPTVR